MNWVLVIFAVVALAAAGGLLWWRRRVGEELRLMAATPTSKAAEVARLAPGTVVEVKGTLRCTGPLTAELSKQSCVYFKSEIQREVVYYENDSQGKRQRKIRTESVQSNTRFAPCAVEDASGRVAINLDGADIEGQQQVVNQREAEARSAAAVLVSAALSGTDSSTLIYTETILPADIPVYVLGEVTAGNAIGKPAAGSKNRVFVVSTKSEEERSKDLGSTMTWQLVAGVLLVVVAAVLVFFAMRSAG